MVTNGELDRYESYFLTARKALDILKTDLELGEKGWTLHFAIDFAELFDLAFPFTQTFHIERQPSELEHEVRSREQATLAFLFSKWAEQLLTTVRDLILLPPYLNELSTTLRAVQMRRFEAYSWTGILRSVQERAYKESYAQVRDTIERYLAEGRIPDNTRERLAVASFIEKEYPDTVSLLGAGDSREGLAILRRILDSQTLSSLKGHFAGQYSLLPGEKGNLSRIVDDNVIKAESEKWLRKLSQLRPERIAANPVDAEACAIIKTLNCLLVKQKSVLLLISHSRAIRRTAENDTPIDAVSIGREPEMPKPEDTALAREAYGNSVSASGVRDLEYMWYYYYHQEATRRETIQRVTSTISMLDAFGDLQAKLKADSAGQQILQVLAGDVLKRCGNLSVGATTVAPLLAWLEETKKGLPAWYGDSRRLADALLRMIRDGRMTTDLVARRDDENAKFESLIRDFEAKLGERLT